MAGGQDPLIAQLVKNLPAMQETSVQFLGQEDPLDKGMATHSSILAWEIPWTERSLAGGSSWSHKESDTTERLSTAQYILFTWFKDKAILVLFNLYPNHLSIHFTYAVNHAL